MPNATQICRSLAKQSGVALIVVMLIVALVTILAVEMSGRLQLNIARTSNVKANNQAFWYALGAEQFAKNSLSTLQSLTKDNINLSQPWAQDFEYPVDGGTIAAKLTDLQACFNLNAIHSAPSSQQQTGANNQANTNNASANSNNNPNNGPAPSELAFQRLLENYIDDSYTVDTVRDALKDWVDQDTIPSPFGAEDADYESLPMPYLPANGPLSHISEVRLLNGVDAAAKTGLLNELKKVICVLPETNLKVNVNTVTEDNAVVLSALLGDTLQTGIDIVNSRPEEGFTDIDDFLTLSEVRALSLTPEQTQWFATTTEYFRLHTTATFQGSQFRMSTVFKLESDNVVIISREFGGAF